MGFFTYLVAFARAIFAPRNLSNRQNHNSTYSERSSAYSSGHSEYFSNSHSSYNNVPKKCLHIQKLTNDESEKRKKKYRSLEMEEILDVQNNNDTPQELFDVIK